MLDKQILLLTFFQTLDSTLYKIHEKQFKSISYPCSKDKFLFKINMLEILKEIEECQTDLTSSKEDERICYEEIQEYLEEQISEETRSVKIWD